ncbi:hypothetical protein HDU76_012799 [Blyttiomyces sp. JEL0837]|nr:hypothetical protein HDU76_012799 [Blyttiomyces sp. JEL0837]
MADPNQRGYPQGNPGYQTGHRGPGNIVYVSPSGAPGGGAPQQQQPVQQQYQQAQYQQQAYAQPQQQQGYAQPQQIPQTPIGQLQQAMSFMSAIYKEQMSGPTPQQQQALLIQQQQQQQARILQLQAQQQAQQAQQQALLMQQQAMLMSGGIQPIVYPGVGVPVPVPVPVPVNPAIVPIAPIVAQQQQQHPLPPIPQGHPSTSTEESGKIEGIIGQLMMPMDMHRHMLWLQTLGQLMEQSQTAAGVVAKLSGVKVILQVMHWHPDFQPLQSQAIFCLWNLASDPTDSYKTDIARNGGIEFILKAMERPPADLDLHRNALGALSTLVQNLECKDRLNNNQGANFALVSMHHFPDDDRVQRRCLILLGGLVKASPSVNGGKGEFDRRPRDAILERSGIDIVLSAMKRFPADRLLQMSALDVVMGISMGSEKGRRLMVSKGVVNLIISAVRQFMDIIGIQVAALGALKALVEGVSRGKEVEVVKAIGDRGVINAVMGSIKQVSATVDMQVLGLELFEKVMIVDDGAKVGFMGSGGTQFVLGILEDCLKNKAAIQACLKCLAGLGKVVGSSIGANNVAGVKGLLDSMRRFPDNPTVQMLAMESLAEVLSPRPVDAGDLKSGELTAADPSAARSGFISLFVLDGVQLLAPVLADGIPVIQSALGRFPDDVFVLMATSKAFAALAGTAKLRSQIKSSHALWSLLGNVQGFPDALELQISAARAIQALASGAYAPTLAASLLISTANSEDDEVNRRAMVEMNVIDHLVNTSARFLNSPGPRPVALHAHVLAALAALAQTHENKIAVADKGGIKFTVNMMNGFQDEDDLQFAGLALLSKLALIRENKAIIRRMLGIDAIVASMSHFLFLNKPYLLRAAMDALTVLGKNPENRSVIVTNGGLRCILTFMEMYVQSPEQQIPAIDTLNALLDKDNVKNFTEERVLDKVGSTMKRFPRRIDIQISCRLFSEHYALVNRRDRVMRGGTTAGGGAS